jgi:chemotaxis regulatin CheY-phosphate phosphatase CheZ
MADELPQIHLELNSGTFRIHTERAVYNILVRPDSTLSQVVDQIIDKGVGQIEPPATPLDWPADETGSEPGEGNSFYQELSQEMFKEIGRLARDLSISLKDVTLEQVKEVNLEGAGRRLEAAKGQLQDVVDLTERATMDIIDRTESIQMECAEVADHLDRLKRLEDDESTRQIGEDLSGAAASYLALSQVAQQAADRPAPALDEPPAPPEPEAPAEPAPEPVTRQVLEVPWEVMFQSLYEFCTNEVVKKHIKAMGEQPDQFDQDLFYKQLGEATEGLTPDDDHFISLPLAKVFEFLFKSTANEEYQQLLRKMNSTISKIFLDPNLTVEPRVTTVTETPPEPEAAPSEPEPAPAAEAAAPALDQAFTELVGELNLILADAPDRERVEAAVGNLGQVILLGPEAQAELAGSAEAVAETMARINVHVTSILESLSFQDLSGQQIKKIVKLLAEFQVQLLAVVVSFGSRMRTYQERADLSLDEGSKLAQQDVDSMLGRIKVGDDADETAPPLDQNEVDRVLGEMGF